MSTLIHEYFQKQAMKIPFGDTSVLSKAKRFIRKTPVAKEMLLGGAAGAAATLAVMPVDTISDTQKQWRMTKGQPELNRISKSFYRTAKEIYHPKVRENAKGGIRPFYAGAAGKMMKVGPSMALTFAAKHGLEKAIK